MKIVIILLLILTSCAQPHQMQLETYFPYTQEETQIPQDTVTKKTITTPDLIDWQNKAYKLISENKVPDTTASKIYAYLAAAQHDFAQISHKQTGKYFGDIASISEATLCEFLPCTTQIKTDPYSQKITQLILKKIRDRIMLDNIQTKPYEIQKAPDNWTGIEPYLGLDAGNWKTWNIQTGSQFRAPMPIQYGTPEFEQQLQKTKNALKYATPGQVIAVVNWAGTPGTKTPPGQWIQITDEYILENNIPLEDALKVRAKLATTMADAVIAVYDSKYTYWVKRPNQADTTIITTMPTPNHPSYPAAHATISSAAATILSYYFPENNQKWQELANEASNSRIWGGIHYPIDVEKGFEQGTKVAQNSLQ